MTLRPISSLLLGLALGLPALGSATAADKGPWDDTWTMDLKEEERTFVDIGGSSYLMIHAEELSDHLFVKDKDVALNAKFATLDKNRASFYQLETLQVIGGTEHWARALDGDNLYLLGTLTIDDKGIPSLDISHVIPAPSDAEIIASKLGKLSATDFAGRLAIAEWAREESGRQGNRAWWIQAASDIVNTTVRAASQQATAKQDLNLLLQAMNWAVEIGGDRALAAELGSQEWVLANSEAGATKVAERMQAMGYVLHSTDDGKRWMTQAEALTSDYHQRLDDLHWRDAQGYYDLGRWADKHADVLPRARELAHQAYLKGQQADPRHAGIRRELGLPPVAAGTESSAYELDFTNAAGVEIAAPQGWDRTPKPVTSNADVTWIDQRSDTAFIAAKVVDHSTPVDIEAVWRKQIETLQMRPGFAPGAVQTGTHSMGRLRRMSYQIKSGDELRPAELVLIYNPKTGYGVALTASFVPSEADSVNAALSLTEKGITLPDRSMNTDDEAESAPEDSAPAQPAPSVDDAPAGGPPR